eukprot:m.105204 g.105204  ORF g.105204 m.105204 type:complete len:476 (+) comp15786_c0_seq2:208-1635(+)
MSFLAKGIKSLSVRYKATRTSDSRDDDDSDKDEDTIEEEPAVDLMLDSPGMDKPVKTLELERLASMKGQTQGILDMLAEIKGAEEFDQVMISIDMKRLFMAFQKKEAKKLMHDVLFLEYFRIHRVDLLSVVVRAKVIAAACASMGILASPFVTDMILTVSGDQLFKLKHALDQGNCALCDMLAQYVEESQRHDLLQFFGFEAERYVAENQITRASRDIHVLSDIDDTFVHSGIGLGGPKYPNGTVIPGVRQLLKELKAHVVFVTARPDFISSHTYGVVRRRYQLTDAVVLSGKLRDSLLVPFKPATANAMISKRKFRNYEMYKATFPECAFMWFGDSGQGDVEVGIQMMADPAGSCIGAYIQDVASPDGISMLTTHPERQKAREKGVEIVDNYVDAAMRMYDKRILSADGLHRTAQSAIQDLLSIRPNFTNRGVLSARLAEMRRHVREVNKVLAARGDTAFKPLSLADLVEQPLN